MADLLDYLRWRGDLLLSERPFCEADSAVLARVSYLPFQALGLGETDVLSLGEAADRLIALPDTEARIVLSGDRIMLKELASSVRYRSMALSGFRYVFDEAKETQFCAMTLHLGDGRRYLSFRGTDNTLVGWKENLNMSFTCPVPAQLLAVAYLREAAALAPGPLLLGGHSKGGNLAVYAGAFCGAEIQDRIETIWNFDGPGFDGKVLSAPVYGRICPRVRTVIPQSSIVGMLLEHEDPYEVVRSEESGLMQHDIYSWEVTRQGFVRLETVTRGSLFLDRAVTDWIRGTDPAQREAFVDAVYEILTTTNAKTLREMNEHKYQSALAVLKTLSRLDEPTRKTVTKTLGAFLRSAARQLGRPFRRDA